MSIWPAERNGGCSVIDMEQANKVIERREQEARASEGLTTPGLVYPHRGVAERLQFTGHFTAARGW